MTTIHRQLPTTLRAALVGLLLAAAAPVMAASYNIILKTTGAVIQTCATGGFTFTKTGVGTFPTTSPSVVLNGSASTPCFGTDQSNKTLSAGTLNVNVADVTLNNQNQGPNVVSIAGNLSSGNGSKNYTIRFLADKTFTVVENTGQNPPVGSGVYHVFNTANAVPEPQTLALVIGSLAALVLSMRLRRRQRAR